MKKFFAALLTAGALASPAAHAQAPAAADPKAAAAVKDMLVAMKYRETLVQMMAQGAGQLPQIILSSATQAIQSQPGLTDEQRKEALAEVTTKLPEITQAVHDVMQDPKLIDEIIDSMPALYSRYFTAAEIAELGKFYRTPLGAKTLKVMPELMAESMQLGQQLVAPRMQRLMQQMQGATKQGK